jgi:hypothetical protein
MDSLHIFQTSIGLSGLRNGARNIMGDSVTVLPVFADA